MRHGDNHVDHFRLGMVFAVSSALSRSACPALRQGVDGRRLEPHRRRHRPTGGRCAGDGGLRHHRPAATGSAGGPAARRRTVVAYGVVPIAGAQLCYYNAVAHCRSASRCCWSTPRPSWSSAGSGPPHDAGPAHDAGRRRPGDRRNHVGAQRLRWRDQHVDAIGVIWGLAAAVCAACYFMMSDKVAASGRATQTALKGLPRSHWPTSGLIVGGAAVTALGVVGIMPLTFTTNDAVIAGFTAPWFVPVSRSAWSAPPSPTRWASAAWPGCGPASRRWSACRRCCSRCWGHGCCSARP